MHVDRYQLEMSILFIVLIYQYIIYTYMCIVNGRDWKMHVQDFMNISQQSKIKCNERHD